MHAHLSEAFIARSLGMQVSFRTKFCHRTLFEARQKRSIRKCGHGHTHWSYIILLQGVRCVAPAPLHGALRPVHAGHRAARHQGPDHQEHATHQQGGQDPHGGHAQHLKGGHCSFIIEGFHLWLCTEGPKSRWEVALIYFCKSSPRSVVGILSRCYYMEVLLSGCKHVQYCKYLQNFTYVIFGQTVNH